MHPDMELMVKVAKEFTQTNENSIGMPPRQCLLVSVGWMIHGEQHFFGLTIDPTDPDCVNKAFLWIWAEMPSPYSMDDPDDLMWDARLRTALSTNCYEIFKQWRSQSGY